VSGLSESHARILRALLAVWDRERFIVIGAAAIEILLGLHWRGTLDLDLSVAAGLDAYPRDLESLGWRRERIALQRWVAPDGTLVDVLPGAPALVAQGGFTWPDGGAHVNLAGFRLAFADAVPVEVAPDLTVRVASLRSLVLLKMAAYLDRPWERDSDLGDLAHILAQYLAPDADERWSDDILDRGLDYEDVSPFTLGKQLGSLVDPTERSLVESFLGRVEDPADRLSTLYRMARRGPAGWKDPDELSRRLLALRRGFESGRLGARPS
jgi:predicted nucleotidyltransferase